MKKFKGIISILLVMFIVISSVPIQAFGDNGEVNGIQAEESESDVFEIESVSEKEEVFDEGLISGEQFDEDKLESNEVKSDILDQEDEEGSILDLIGDKISEIISTEKETEEEKETEKDKETEEELESKDGTEKEESKDSEKEEELESKDGSEKEESKDSEKEEELESKDESEKEDKEKEEEKENEEEKETEEKEKDKEDKLESEDKAADIKKKSIRITKKNDIFIEDVLPAKDHATVIVINSGFDTNGKVIPMKESGFSLTQKANVTESINNDSEVHIFKDLPHKVLPYMLEQTKVNDGFHIKDRIWEFSVGKKGIIHTKKENENRIGDGEIIPITDISVLNRRNKKTFRQLERLKDRVLILRIVNDNRDNELYGRYFPEDTSGFTGILTKIKSKPYPLIYIEETFKLVNNNPVKIEGYKVDSKMVSCYNLGMNFIPKHNNLYEEVFYKKFEQPDNLYNYLLGRYGLGNDNPNFPSDLNQEQLNEYLKKRLGNIYYCTELEGKYSDKYLGELKRLCGNDPESMEKLIGYARQLGVWYFTDNFPKVGIDYEFDKTTLFKLVEGKDIKRELKRLVRKLIEADEALPEIQHFYFYIPYSKNKNGKWELDRLGQMHWQYYFNIDFEEDTDFYFNKSSLRLHKGKHLDLEGAEFKLEYLENKKRLFSRNDNWVESDKKIVDVGEGRYKIAELNEIGSYRIIETKAPDKYLIGNKVVAKFDIVQGENNKLKPDNIKLINENGLEVDVDYGDINIKNIKNSFNFKIKKVDENGNPVSGAVFRVTDSKGNTFNMPDDGDIKEVNGVVNKELESGKYIVKEIKNPDGYVLDAKDRVVYIGRDRKVDFTKDGKNVDDKIEVEGVNIDNKKGSYNPNKLDPLEMSVKFRVKDQDIKDGDTFKVKLTDNVEPEKILKNQEYNLYYNGYFIGLGKLSDNGKAIEYKLSNFFETEKLEGDVILEARYKLQINSKSCRPTYNELNMTKVRVGASIGNSEKTEEIMIDYKLDNNTFKDYSFAVTGYDGENYTVKAYINRNRQKVRGSYTISTEAGSKIIKAHKLYRPRDNNLEFLPANFDYKARDDEKLNIYKDGSDTCVNIRRATLRWATVALEFTVPKREVFDNKLKIKLLMPNYTESGKLTETVEIPKEFIDIPETVFEMTNKKDNGELYKLHLRKKDLATGEAIKGAEFKLTGPDGYENKIKFEDKEEMIINGLKAGEYILKETKAPAGYQLDENLEGTKILLGENIETDNEETETKEFTESSGYLSQGVLNRKDVWSNKEIKLSSRIVSIDQKNKKYRSRIYVNRDTIDSYYKKLYIENVKEEDIKAIYVLSNKLYLNEEYNFGFGRDYNCIANYRRFGRIKEALNGTVINLDELVGKNNNPEYLGKYAYAIDVESSYDEGTQVIKTTQSLFGFTKDNNKESDTRENYVVSDKGMVTFEDSKEIERVYTANKDKVVEIDMYNKRKPIIFNKQNTGNKPMANVSFVLKDEKGKIVAEELSLQNGDLTFENLRPGIYYLYEIGTQDGYLLPEDYLRQIIIEKDRDAIIVDPKNESRDAEANMVIKNFKDATVDIRVNKTNTDGDGLAGVQFKITGANLKEPVIITTDKNGHAETANIPYGLYFMQEIKGADGYVVDDKIREIVVGGEYDTPNELGEDVSEYIDLKGSIFEIDKKVSKKESNPDKNVINPNIPEFMYFKNEFNISAKDSSKINAGDYFILKLSDTIEADGIIKNSEKDFNLTSGGGLIAKGLYNREKNEIKYVFTNYVDEIKLREMKASLQVFVNREKITGNDPAVEISEYIVKKRTKNNDKESTDEIRRTIGVEYNPFSNVYENKGENIRSELGARIIMMDTENYRYKQVLYVMPNENNEERPNSTITIQPGIEMSDNENIGKYIDVDCNDNNKDSSAIINENTKVKVYTVSKNYIHHSFAVSDEDMENYLSENHIIDMTEKCSIEKRENRITISRIGDYYYNNYYGNSVHVDFLNINNRRDVGVIVVIEGDYDKYSLKNLKLINNYDMKTSYLYKNRYYTFVERVENNTEGNGVIETNIVNFENSISFVKKGDDGKILPGVKFKLQNEDGLVAKNVDGEECIDITDSNGMINFKRLADGRYTLQEIQAAPGYVLKYGDLASFDVVNGSIINIEEEEKIITNNRLVIPDTGVENFIPYAVLGSILATSASIILKRRNFS